jgi:phage/plasmid-like protein (TIGR03299 family)
MSHDIDFSTGKAAMAYVGETPWHGLGECLPCGQPIEAWAKAAQLEWELKRLPVQYLVDGKLRTMEGSFVLARSDNGAAMSIVKDDYKIVQPKDVLEFYRDLVSYHGYTLETAGALNGGRKVWALARTGRADAAIGEFNKDDTRQDHLAAYVLLATSCDKTLATTAAFTSIRVVCQNTLFFAMDDIKWNRRAQVKVPHNLRFDPNDVKEELGLIDSAWSEFMGKVRKMAQRKMERADATKFFQSLLSDKDGKLTGKAQREYETIMSLFASAPGQDLTSAKDTLWGAVNAVTYFVDHVRKGGTMERLDSAWFGPGSSLKEKAWESAVQMLA